MPCFALKQHSHINYRHRRRPTKLWSACVVLVMWGGCDRYRPAAELPPAVKVATATEATNDSGEEHAHQRGIMGGAVVSLGEEAFHAEAVLLQAGRLSLYVLGADQTQLQEAPSQTLTAYARPAGDQSSVALILTADPLPGDTEGMTTRFSGTLPAAIRQQSLSVMIPGLRIQDQRFAVRFSLPPKEAPDMPAPVQENVARELYLTAGGLYCEQDIRENGQTTAAEKYQGFRAAHDAQPDAGARICPITQTKAHPQCTWVIGGETYYFCCPPCIDEFLSLAKTKPEQVHPPDTYRK